MDIFPPPCTDEDKINCYHIPLTNTKELPVLSKINWTVELKFPVTLDLITTETIEETTNVLDLTKLDVTRNKQLADLIAQLIFDMLVWYSERVEKCNEDDSKGYEKQGFLPFIYYGDWLDITDSARFYAKKKEEEYEEKATQELLDFKQKFFKLLPSWGSQKMAKEIRTCIDYELRKLNSNDVPITDFVKITITYKVKERSFQREHSI